MYMKFSLLTIVITPGKGRGGQGRAGKDRAGQDVVESSIIIDDHKSLSVGDGREICPSSL